MKKPMRRIRRFLVPFILVICLFSQASACSLLFVGDTEENIIDWRLSLNDYKVEILPETWQNNVFERVSLTLNRLEETEKWNTENAMETNDYIMTNVSKDGTIVPLHNDV